MFSMQSEKSNAYSFFVRFIDLTPWHFSLFAEVRMQLRDCLWMFFYIDIGHCRESEIPNAWAYHVAKSIRNPIGTSQVKLQLFKRLF